MSQSNQEFNFSFRDILIFLYQWRKHLIIVSVIAIIASSIFTAPMFMTPQFQSEVEFYPTTINSIGNAFFTEFNQREADVLAFGEEEEAENALQLLQSSSVQNRIVHNFNMMEHYGINPEVEDKPLTKLGEMMGNNFNYSRTKGLSVKISVLDEDPVFAAKVANGIAQIYDTVKTEIQQQVAKEALAIVEEEYTEKRKEVQEIRERLQAIANRGVTNYDEQSRAIAEEIYKIRAAGNSARVLELKNFQDTLAKYGPEHNEMTELLVLELENLSNLRKKYKKAKVDVEKTITHKFVITEASVAESKTKPRRKIIVGLVTMATFLFAVFVIVSIEQIRSYKVARENDAATPA